MIWNLSEREYDYGKFDNQLQDFGFPDHHSPPLDMLFKIILSMDNWLRASKDNVAVVHCMGGKGRTGTVIACYLLYCGLFESPQPALSYFAERRSKIAKGVIQPSQLRYVSYFGKILREKKTPMVNDVIIRRVYCHGVPKLSKKREGCKPILKVYNVSQLPKRLLFASGDPRDENLFVDADQGGITWNTECLTKGDIMIKCKHYGESKKLPIFKTTFHTAFTQNVVKLDLKELDATLKPKQQRRPDTYPDDFHIVIYFDSPDAAAAAAAAGGASTDSQVISGAEATPAMLAARSRLTTKVSATEASSCPRCLLYVPKDMAVCGYCRATITQ